MNGKRAKTLRKFCNAQGLPKGIYRRVKKVSKQYNLNVTQTLFLIEKASDMFYAKMSEVTKQMEEIENGES